VKVLNSWIKTPSPTNIFFLVLKFFNLVILVGKKWKKVKIQKKKKQQKELPEI
jgi:hypothetical protein